MMLAALCLALLLGSTPEITRLDTGFAGLRGLPGLAVRCESVARGVRTLGVDETWLESRATKGMKLGHVPPLTLHDAATDPRQPLLVVRLHTVQPPGRTFVAWHLAVAVYCRILCPGDSTTSPLLTQVWAANSTLGVSSMAVLEAEVGDSLDQQIAELASAWRQRARP